MNILFLTLSRMTDISNRGIYTDLLREFVKRGHDIYVVTPFERRFHRKTHLSDSEKVHILGIKTLNIQKTNIIEKGVGTILLEYQYGRAISKYWGGIQFDLFYIRLRQLLSIELSDLSKNGQKQKHIYF